MELKGSDKLMKKLQEIAESMNAGSVSVGFMAGAKYPDGTPVPNVAFWNEFGTVNAPPRPFFRTMIEKESGTWPEKMAAAAKAASYDGEQVLGLMGEDIKGALQQSINDLTAPELAESTKARKGFDKPLIDTGHMLNSISYVVEK